MVCLSTEAGVRNEREMRWCLKLLEKEERKETCEEKMEGGNRDRKRSQRKKLEETEKDAFGQLVCLTLKSYQPNTFMNFKSRNAKDLIWCIVIFDIIAAFAALIFQRNIDSLGWPWFPSLPILWQQQPIVPVPQTVVWFLSFFKFSTLLKPQVLNK